MVFGSYSQYKGGSAIVDTSLLQPCPEGNCPLPGASLCEQVQNINDKTDDVTSITYTNFTNPDGVSAMVVATSVVDGNSYVYSYANTGAAEITITVVGTLSNGNTSTTTVVYQKQTVGGLTAYNLISKNTV